MPERINELLKTKPLYNSTNLNLNLNLNLDLDIRLVQGGRVAGVQREAGQADEPPQYSVGDRDQMNTQGCGVVWCGVVWRGVVWRGVAWCGVMSLLNTASVTETKTTHRCCVFFIEFCDRVYKHVYNLT